MSRSCCSGSVFQKGIRRIMPSESKPLPPKEIAILTQWLEGGLKWEGRGAFKEAPLALRKVEAVAKHHV